MTILRGLRWPSRRLHQGQGGQTAIAFMLTLLFVFILFALAFDAGAWFFDHRTAQNQAEAAALAAVQQLPAADTTAATAAADEALIANGSDGGERSCLEFEDRNGDGRYETARVCVQRNSAGGVLEPLGRDVRDRERGGDRDDRPRRHRQRDAVGGRPAGRRL